MVKQKLGALAGAFLLVFFFSSFSAQATTIKTNYSWCYNKKLLTINYAFDQSDYNFYKNKSRVYSDFTVYLYESASVPVIEQFADQFRLLAATNGYSDWQTVECIVNFIQSLKYKNDGTYEYPRYPIETLVEKGGDCEDTAILLVALLRELGFDCVLVSPEKHMGVGIALKYEIDGAAFRHNDKYYYYIETTSSGWTIGDYPEHLSDDVVIYDPGELSGAKLLSEYSYSFKDYSEATISTTTNAGASDEQEEQASEPAYNYNYSSTPTGESKPGDSYTIDVDNIIIDGEKETMVTKKVESDGQEK